jgi:hypothetical protein
VPHITVAEVVDQLAPLDNCISMLSNVIITMSKPSQPYHHAIATAPKEIRGAIRAAAVYARSRDQARKTLMNSLGTKTVYKATSGYLLESHQQKVYSDALPPHPEAN